MGGEIIMQNSVKNVIVEGHQVKALEVVDEVTKETRIIKGELFLDYADARFGARYAHRSAS